MVALKTLDSSYAATQTFPKKGDVGFHERVGPYQGEIVKPVVKDAYERELETQLLQRVTLQPMHDRSARTERAEVDFFLGGGRRLLRAD